MTLIEKNVINGGMIPKVLGCIEALKRSWQNHIIDGRIPHCLLLEIFTNKGIELHYERKNPLS